MLTAQIRAFEKYLRIERNVSENTCRGYLQDLAGFIDFLQDTHSGTFTAVGDIDALAIRAYLATCAQHNKKTTQARKLSCLKTFFLFWCGKVLLPLIRLKC